MAVVFVVVGVEGGVIPERADVCDKPQDGQKSECTTYDLAPFVIIEVLKTSNDLSPLITALATAVIAAYTLTLARVGKGQHTAAMDALRLAREEFNATHRPRIEIRHVWLAEALAPDAPVAVNLLFVNIGDVKCYVNKVGIDFNVLDNDGILPGGMEPAARAIEQTECGLGVTLELKGIESFASFDASRIDAIKRGTKTLCCFGFVEYSDGLTLETKRYRRTAFCRIYQRPVNEAHGIGRFVLPAQSDPDYEFQN